MNSRLASCAAALMLLVLTGCTESPPTDTPAPQAESATARPVPAPQRDGAPLTAESGGAAESGPLVVVHLSPYCGCCMDWVDHIEAAGFATRVHLANDVNGVRRLLGVPDQLASCHTATVDGYLVEGHVPAADIRRLLEERPQARGIAVPAMPIGSPGMEMGDRRDPFDVLVFDGERAGVFSHYPGG
jgi:hypothetical protein